MSKVTKNFAKQVLKVLNEQIKNKAHKLAISDLEFHTNGSVLRDQSDDNWTGDFSSLDTAKFPETLVDGATFPAYIRGEDDMIWATVDLVYCGGEFSISLDVEGSKQWKRRKE